jgi:hypothetical protein
MGMLGAPVASALVISNVADPAGDLTTAVLAAGGGITVVGTSAYQGNQSIGGGADFQAGIYTGFNLPPSSGSTPTLTLSDGIVLTSGRANMPLTNTTNGFSNALTQPGSGSNALLSTLAGTNTNDANALTIRFTTDGANNSVSAKFVFGTDEFPTQSVTDIFGFFVDGVNYAKFPSGELISNTPGNPTNFILNPVGGGLYDIEYNGLTQVFTVTGLLDASLSEHEVVIAVADTSDSIYDSGVFIAGLTAGVTSGGGGIGNGNGQAPEPGTLALLGAALAGLWRFRRGRS